MPTTTTGGGREPSSRAFGYSFAVLVLGLGGILVGVAVVESVPATVVGALVAVGYALVYVGFLASLYLDVRGDGTARRDRPMDGESG